MSEDNNEDTNVVSINEFNGLGNKLDPLTNYGFLKSGINVDIDNSKNIRRRSGFAAPISYTDITSSYSTKNGKHAYIVDNGSVIHVNTGIVVTTGITDTVYWDDYNDSVFIYSNKIGLIENNTFTNLKHTQYQHAKVVRTNGTQPAGYYQVACAYIDENGREGGITSPVTILIEDNSALSISVDQIADHEVSIYISPVNGKYLYKVMTTTEDTVIWDGPQHLLASPLNDTQLGSSAIPSNGTYITYYKNILYVSEYLPTENKTVIWFSKPYSYHLFDRSKDYIVINDKVNCLINIEKQLVIGAENSIYYYNNKELKQVTNYGVPSGHPFGVDEHSNYFLYTYNGICKLNEFMNLTTKIHKLPTSPEVFSVVVNQNGYGRFVNLLSDKTDADNIFRS